MVSILDGNHTRIGILSCAHVLNGYKSFILQKTRGISIYLKANNEFQYVGLLNDSILSNRLDAAVAEIESKKVLEELPFPEICEFRSLNDLDKGKEITVKVPNTENGIKAIISNVSYDYPTQDGYRLFNTFLIKSKDSKDLGIFKGQSGSLIVDENETPIGILSAIAYIQDNASNKIIKQALCIKIDRIFAALSITTMKN